MEQEVNTSNMDGAVQMYDVIYPNNNLGGNYNDNDDFYPATGRLRNLMSNMRKNKAKRQARKDTRVKSRAQARLNRTGAKKEAAKGLSDPSADIAMSKALAKMSSGPAPSAEKKGLSTMAWVGIGVGVLALGVGAYFMLKKK